MPAELRPRVHGPPQDHNYSHRRTGDQSYNEHDMPYVRKGIAFPMLLGFSTRYSHFSSDEESDIAITEEQVTSKVSHAETEAEQKVLVQAQNTSTKYQQSCDEQKKRKRKRRQFACYDFGIPKRRKRQAKVSRSVKSIVHPYQAWDPLTSNASLGSENMCTIAKVSASPDDSVESPVKCHSCCPSWHSFRRKAAKRIKMANSTEPHRQSQRLVIKNYKLPFEDLPTECKLHIFHFLTPQERGLAARVCSEWYGLMGCSSLWSHLDLSDFDTFTQLTVSSKAGYHTVIKQPMPTPSKYTAYKEQMAKFLGYLGAVEPSFQSLQFSFDVGHPRDEWLKLVLTLLRRAKCHSLTHLRVNWTNTPMRPPMETFCCIYNKIRTLYRRHHHRSASFHLLLDQITKCAPNLEVLAMPFDWLPRSVLLLSRLHSLRRLHLTQYMTLKGVSQQLFDVALMSLPGLTHLELQVCMPLHSSKATFKISHPNIQTLDISQSKGFFLRDVDLPQLSALRIYNNSWRGPLVDNPELKPACLYTILRQGAPNLVMFNKHRLYGYWQEYLYEELAAHLYRACPCRIHTVVPSLP